MQLPQSTPEIPELGGLSSRRADLAERGSDALRKVSALLSRARRRARLLALLRAAALAGAAFVVAGLAGALLGSVASAAVSRGVTIALFGIGLVAAAVFLVRTPLQKGAGWDDRALARLLAGPSEILSSVELSRPEHTEEVRGVSRELLALLHVRAAAQASSIDPRRALPLRLVAVPAGVLALSLVALLVCGLVAQRRLALGLTRLRLGDAAAPEPEPSPIVGDLSVTYLYPAYTGLPARTEEGTSGDLRAPKGTEVRLSARADRDVDSAAAIVNGKPVKLLAQGQGHRLLSGGFSLSAPGKWSFQFFDPKGRVIAKGPERPIEVVADAAPQVSIEDPKEKTLEVDPQGRVVLSWAATDDYGLSEIALRFQLAGEKERRVVLLTPSSAAKRLRGSYSWELAPLHLRPGDKVTYAVEAKDNDAVDGPQKGASAVQVLKVFSAAEHSRESLLRAQALWERLVAVTADRIEEPPPPSDKDAQAWYSRTSAKDAQVLQLAGDLQRAGTDLLKDKLTPKAIGRALRYAASGLSPAVRRTSLARAPLARGSEAGPSPVRALDRALRAEIAEEEKDILYLEDLLDRARIDAMQELGKELAASRRELARLADKLRKAPDEETKREVLAEVARLRERIQDLMQRMAEMAKGIRDEHLNQEAIENVEKQQDLLSQLSDIQRKLQSGKIDDALKQLDQLGQKLADLEKNLSQKADDQQRGQYAEEAKQLAQAAQKLKDLEARERQLAQRTSELRKRAQSAAQKRFDQQGGKELAKKLREKVEQAKKGIKEIDPKLAERLGLEDVLETADSRANDLGRALDSGNFDEAAELAERSLRALQTLQGRLSMEEQLAQRYPGFARDPEAVKRGMKGAQTAVPPMQEVSQALQQMLPRDGQSVSPQDQEELRKQEQAQREISNELSQARKDLQDVGRRVPIFGPQHEQMLQEAQDGMGRAQERLGRGEPRGAQAGEEQAVEKLSQFQKSMEQMAKKGGKGQGQGMPMPWGDPQGDEDGEEEGNSDAMRHDRVEIPDAEASRGPQEFRKELLDAMKQQAPEKFKERVKQYYEELVK
ncbi:MAG: DUF4175 family protein [Myxococcales bacterium]